MLRQGRWKWGKEPEEEEGAGHRGELSSPNPRRAAPPGQQKVPCPPRHLPPEKQVQGQAGLLPSPLLQFPGPGSAGLPAQVSPGSLPPWHLPTCTQVGGLGPWAFYLLEEDLRQSWGRGEVKGGEAGMQRRAPNAPEVVWPSGRWQGPGRGAPSTLGSLAVALTHKACLWAACLAPWRPLGAHWGLFFLIPQGRISPGQGSPLPPLGPQPTPCPSLSPSMPVVSKLRWWESLPPSFSSPPCKRWGWKPMR